MGSLVRVQLLLAKFRRRHAYQAIKEAVKGRFTVKAGMEQYIHHCHIGMLGIAQ